MSNQIDYIESNYLTKEKLIYKGVSSRDNFEDYWNNLQSTRKQNSRKVPLKGKSENNFWYNITTETKESIYEIEELGRDKIEDIIPDEVKKMKL